MTSAVADRIELSFAAEQNFAEIDTSASKTPLRITAESFTQNTQSAASAEIRADRQVSDVVRTSANAEGGFDFELSHGTFDTLIAAALFSADFPAEAVLVDVDGNVAVTITQATGNINGLNLFGGVQVGDWLQLSNFANAENNVLVKVSEFIDGENVRVVGARALVDEVVAADSGSANAKIVRGSQIKNGTVQRSFSFERNYTDLNRFAIFRGMTVESMSLSVAADSFITGSFAFRGKAENELATASPFTGPVPPLQKTEVLNSTDNVLNVMEGDLQPNQVNTLAVTQVTFDLNNNLRDLNIVGELGPDCIGAGKIAVTGTLQAYFASQAAADKYLRFDSSAITLLVRDRSNNIYVVELPRVKFTQGTKVAGGENSDVILDMAFQAFAHETESTTIRIVKFAG